MRGLNGTRCTIAAIFAAAVLTLVSASAASAVVPGGLQATECLSNAAAAPCATVTQIGTPRDVAVSPDGANVYVITAQSALVTFSRDATTGRLTFQHCFRGASAVAGCVPLPGPVAALSSPTALAVTPDGGSVYVATDGQVLNDMILEFDRGAGGLLALKSGAPCIGNAGGLSPSCTDADAMLNPADLAIDGDKLYVASSGSDSVTMLHIGPGGALTQPGDIGTFGVCVAAVTPNADGCGLARGLDGANAIAVRGDKVYVATAAKRIVSINRDPGSGQLRGGTALNTCIGVALGGCTTLAEVGTPGVTDIAVGAEGQLYAAIPPVSGGQTARVITFDPSGEGLTRRVSGGCVHTGATAAGGCSVGRWITNPTQLLATADGQDVYVAGGSGGGIVELNRAAGGTLTLRNDARGCVGVGVLGCSSYAGATTPTGVAMAPDGRHVYTISSAGRLVTLRRDSSSPICSTSAITVEHGFQGPIAIPCYDPDGDPLTFTTITPPTLGGLGAFDHGAASVIYAAPQGQNGSTTIAFRATYTSFGTFIGDGSVQVSVVGVPPVVLPGGIDADRDGFTAGQDCRDDNPNIRPGATEVKGNSLDENCDGVAEPFPTLTSGVAHTWSWKKRGKTFTLRTLQITQQFPKGWKAQARCSGKKCPFKRKTLKPAKVKKSAASVIASFSKKQRRFRVGQTLEIWVSAPNFNTKVARIKFKKGKQPAIVPYCVLPGSSKVQKTCT